MTKNSSLMLVVLSLLFAVTMMAQDATPNRREKSGNRKHQEMEKSVGETTPKLWWDNYELALKTAKKEKKAVLVLFTGSDWCGWCKKLHKDFLEKDDFKKLAKKDIIPVFLDFPSKKVSLNPALVEQNKELQQEYGVRGYPTLFVLDSEGERIGQLGYNKDFQKQLEDMVKKALDKKKADKKEKAEDGNDTRRKRRKNNAE